MGYKISSLSVPWLFTFVALCAISMFAFVQPTTPLLDVSGKIDTGDTAWMLAATGLVLLMTPGLAFFYGGMVSRKNIISTMFQSCVAMGLVSVLWIVFGFSLCFGSSIGGVIGNITDHFMLRGVGGAPNESFAATIPFILYALFQLKFAIITPALITGAFAERIRFSAYLLFVVLWSTLIYTPVAHWTWHPEGFLRQWGVLDFAGGTVVHMTAGFAALAGAIYLGQRETHKLQQHHAPANVPFVILGTGLLWFGWFGFNAGSALAANELASLAFLNTNTASAAAMISWMAVDVLRGRKPSAMGACIGAVVGLVAITPAAGFVTVAASVFIGTFSALVSNFAAHWKAATDLDDTLDVFPCHAVGGMFGMVATAVFAVPNGVTSGNWSLLGTHLLGLAIVASYSFFGSMLLYRVVEVIIPLRVTKDDEQQGLDHSQHGETVLDFSRSINEPHAKQG